MTGKTSSNEWYLNGDAFREKETAALKDLRTTVNDLLTDVSVLQAKMEEREHRNLVLTGLVGQLTTIVTQIVAERNGTRRG